MASPIIKDRFSVPANLSLCGIPYSTYVCRLQAVEGGLGTVVVRLYYVRGGRGLSYLWSSFYKFVFQNEFPMESLIIRAGQIK